MKEEVSIVEMQRLVEKYIRYKTGQRVVIDIEGYAKQFVLPHLIAQQLKNQLIKLNVAYNIAYDYFNTESK